MEKIIIIIIIFAIPIPICWFWVTNFRTISGISSVERGSMAAGCSRGGGQWSNQSHLLDEKKVTNGRGRAFSDLCPPACAVAISAAAERKCPSSGQHLNFLFIFHFECLWRLEKLLPVARAVADEPEIDSLWTCAGWPDELNELRFNNF